MTEAIEQEQEQKQLIKPFNHSCVLLGFRQHVLGWATTAYFEGRAYVLGVIKQNRYGLWSCGNGRYYSNHIPAGFDQAMMFVSARGRKQPEL